MNSNSTEGRGTAIFLLLALSLIWGTSFILMKRGLEVYPAGEVAGIRVVAAWIILLPFAISRFAGLTKSHLLKLFVSGMLGIFIPAFLFATAQTKMESALTGILNSLTPICVLTVGISLFNQKFKVRSLIGILIGFAGTIVLITSRAGGEFAGINLYAILVIAACLCYGINVNFIKFKLADLNALTITSVAVTLIGPFAAIYLFAFTDFSTRVATAEGSGRALGFLILLGVMSTSVATLLFNRLIKISTPIFASSSTYIIPVVAVMWGLGDNEVLLPGHFIGMAAIILGVYITNRK